MTDAQVHLRIEIRKGISVNFNSHIQSCLLQSGVPCNYRKHARPVCVLLGLMSVSAIPPFRHATLYQALASI